jgi:hypothetical protein
MKDRVKYAVFTALLCLMAGCQQYSWGDGPMSPVIFDEQAYNRAVHEAYIWPRNGWNTRLDSSGPRAVTVVRRYSEAPSGSAKPVVAAPTKGTTP